MFNTLSRDILKEILIRLENDEVVMEIKDFNFGKSSSTPLMFNFYQEKGSSSLELPRT